MLRCCCILAAAGIAFPLIGFARELVCLSNGFCLDVVSHSQEENRITLSVGAGTLEFPADQIARIEVVKESPTPPSAEAVRVTSADLLTEAAGHQQIPPELVRSVAKVESGFRTDAVSNKSAMGLMQLMPSTAAELGVDAKVASQNAEGGAKYLRQLLLRYHGDSALALAAYNAGPGAVDKHHGVPPYAETRGYVIRVLREYERQHRAKSSGPSKAGLSKTTATN